LFIYEKIEVQIYSDAHPTMQNDVNPQTFHFGKPAGSPMFGRFHLEYLQSFHHCY
jgi:hypothetical protein